MPCWHIFFSTWQLKMIARYCNYLKIVKTVPQHFHLCVCVCVKLLSCVLIFVIPWTSLADFSIRGIFQPRVLEWAAISFSRGSSQPGDQTQVSYIAGRCFTLYSINEIGFFLLFNSTFIAQTFIKCQESRIHTDAQINNLK